MSAARRHAALIAGTVLPTALLIALAITAPRQTAGGWLIAFVFWCGISVGSLVLMMIHRLTTGRWGDVLGPTLAHMATAIPIMALLIIPVLAALPTIYQWMHGSPDVSPSVAKLYLNQPLFIIRSAIAFVGWTALALSVPRSSGTKTRLLCGLGLVFYGLTISTLPVDWVLSVEYPFVSESFGASVAITQMISALAWAILLTPVPARDPVLSDLGGLLLAMVLGITYVDFMAVLILWYGDLPHKVFWFVQRDQPPWLWLALASFVFCSVVPILSLLLERVRNSLTALRAVAAIELVGMALYHAWLLAPAFGVSSLPAALLALIAIGSLLTGLISGGWFAPPQSPRSAAHAR